MDYVQNANAKPLPPNYAPPEAWPEFGALMMPQPISKREPVGTNPRGARWGVWPLIFEEYVSDKEPRMADSQAGSLAYNRMVFWKRVARTDIPKGWHKAVSNKSWRIDGYHQLVPGTDYTARWSKKARHDLLVWQGYEAKGYRIEEVPFPEFKEAYLQSTVYKTQGNFLINMLERKLTLPEVRGHLVLWAARNSAGKIIAGTAAHYSDEYKSSMRECPFMLPEARECQASTGLMDYWFKECERRGISLLLFTYFWQPGESKSWRGFSTFKSHFATDYVKYPPTLWRFVRGKFW